MKAKLPDDQAGLETLKGNTAMLCKLQILNLVDACHVLGLAY